MYRYEIITCTVKGMVNCHPEQLNLSGERVFSFDFTKIYDRRKVICQTESKSASALTYQIIRALCGNDERQIEEMLPDSHCLLRSLIYMDFAGFFPNWNDKNYTVLNSLFKNGFSIRFDELDERHYVPFDKSQSMSRRYVITFIDEQIFPQVDESIRLGIPFHSTHNWDIAVTKYYAYRGLCLTDGIRIPEGRGNEFKLDESTVIVLAENKRKMKGIECLTARVSEDGTLTEEKCTECDKTDFDGEGLISPDYAEYLNKILSRERKKTVNATSFQIRMPFTKGMLHTVDFNGFLSEQVFGDRPCSITDAFGIKRDLSKARIVLNASMFKCFGWLKQYASHLDSQNEKPDMMKLYFERFNLYSHALYVANTDTVAGGSTVPMNYQFLNTITFKEENALSDLIADHISQALSIEQKYIGEAGEICAACAAESDEEAEDDPSNERIIPELPSWQYAISKNKAFLFENHVKSILDSEVLSKIKDICSGRILVKGSVKYLSEDLLAFLCEMADLVSDRSDKEKSIIRSLKDKTLRSDRFYVADHKTLKLTYKKKYAILRSPHLSRNEQCILRPFIPDRNNLYTKYFSHLTGVIMLPYSSVDAVALGGADYDGDMVKLITDRTICNAVFDSSYENNTDRGQDGKAGREFIRSYPIVNIPNYAKVNYRNSTIKEHIGFDIVRDTFSNQIGKISNAAVKEGMKIYMDTSGDKERYNHIALYTIATGVDIDAAKTGVRPDIEKLITSDISSEWKEFNGFKDAVDKVTNNRFLTSGTILQETTDKGQVLTLERNSGSECFHLKATLYAPEQNVPTLCRLPGEMLHALLLYREQQADRTARFRSMSKDEADFCFIFQADESGSYNRKWADDCDNEIINKLSGCIIAYRKAKSSTRALSRSKIWAEKIDYIGRIITNLKLGFDIDREPVPGSYLSVRDAVSYVYADLERLFTDQKTLAQVIKRLYGNALQNAPSNAEGLTGNKWVTARREALEETLMAILGNRTWLAGDIPVLDDVLLPETKALLLSPHDNSFDLLPFFLKDIRGEMKRNQTMDERLDYIEWIKNTSDNDKKDPFEGYSEEFYETLLSSYRKREQLKESESNWNKDVIRDSRNYMRKLFEGDMQKAMKYYWAAAKQADKSHMFFWDVFSTADIIDTIHSNPYAEPNTGE